MALPLIPIVSALTSLAPTVGRLIAGDKGEDAANAVSNIVRDVAGVNDPQDAVNAVLADPNLQLEFMKKLDSNKVALDKAYLADVQDARKNNQHSVMPALIAVSLTVMVALMGFALFKSVIPESNMTLANILFGAVLAKWADAIAYWVGSSRGSAEKTHKLS